MSNNPGLLSVPAFSENLNKDTLGKAVEGLELVKVLFLDTETTGLDPNLSELIEVGCILTTFSKSGQLISVDDALNMLEQPKNPIPDFITNINGITDSEVEGLSFDLEALKAILSKADIVLAHNAKFDAGFINARFGNLGITWGCTRSDYDWSSHGHESRRLTHLLEDSGYVYEAHRATNDCEAMVQLLKSNPEAAKAILNKAEKTEQIGL